MRSRVSAGVLAILSFVGIGVCGVQVHIRTVKPELLKQRLEAYHGNDDQREATLKRIFEQAGCGAERLTEQPVKHLKQPNLICVLPGDSDATILIEIGRASCRERV